MEFIYEDKVGYSGPTYMAIRSGKHASSTAETHTFYFTCMLQQESDDMRHALFTDNGLINPILIFMVDGGQTKISITKNTIWYYKAFHRL